MCGHHRPPGPSCHAHPGHERGSCRPTAVTVACFTRGGAIYGPFVPLSITLLQKESSPEHLTAMLAARSAALLTASPLGTALGGPLTTSLGARATLSGSGTATVVGGVAGLLLLVRRGTERVGSDRRRLPTPRSVAAIAERRRAE